MTKRKIEDEAEARRCLSAVEAEGGDIRRWAGAHGIDGRSLHAWRVNFARWDGGRSSTSPPPSAVSSCCDVDRAGRAATGVGWAAYAVVVGHVPLRARSERRARRVWR
jgi:hypothetical protein